jgi:NADPH:quinone reductase
MSKAFRFDRYGGPEVLRFEDVGVGAPGRGEVRMRNVAVAVNYRDVLMRRGVHTVKSFPSCIGLESAGVIDAVGPEVDGVAVGDRVACAGMPEGSYAELRIVPAARLIPLPAGIDERTAASMMIRGMTARSLLKDTYKVQPGDTIVIHAAAGGVGLILCQWANHLGANVIGTVGSKEKADLAKANGCHHTILYSTENFVDRVKQITNGALCEVVYDGIGKTTFPASLDCIKPLGMFVSFGSASGPVTAFDINILQQKGSLFATRPTLNTYAAKRADLLDIAADLFKVVGSGAVKIPVNQTYKLKDAQKAHVDLESRKTTGSSILVP